MKILFAAKDVGGCESLIPLVKYFSKGKHQIFFLSEGPSNSKLNEEKIPHKEVDGLSEKIVEKIILNFRPDKVITGTSLGNSVEKKIIKFSKKYEFFVISIVDYWSNYVPRFGRSKNHELILPNLICVTDELMKKEMVTLGFNKKFLKVTGNPSFNALVKKKKHRVNKRKILFLSQPFSEPKYFNQNRGYDEIEVIKDLFQVLEKINKKNFKNFEILIRPHPQEEKLKWILFLKNFSGKTRVCLDLNQDYKKSLDSSFIVFGMCSMGLFHAALMGKKVLSYQPRVKSEWDFSILNKLGLSKTITSKIEMQRKLKELIIKNSQILNKVIAKKYTRKETIKNIVSILLSNQNEI